MKQELGLKQSIQNQENWARSSKEKVLKKTWKLLTKRHKRLNNRECGSGGGSGGAAETVTAGEWKCGTNRCHAGLDDNFTLLKQHPNG